MARPPARARVVPHYPHVPGRKTDGGLPFRIGTARSILKTGRFRNLLIPLPYRPPCNGGFTSCFSVVACSRVPRYRKLLWGTNRVKTSELVLVVLFGVSIAAAGNGATAAPQNPPGTAPSNGTPQKPFPRLLPLQLTVPTTAQAGVPLEGITVTLQNPGHTAPDSRLRLSIHEANHAAGHVGLSPATVMVEVLQGGSWVPVHLGMVDENVMGAIGAEGGAAHRERHARGGFAIPAGLNKTWQLRITFSLPGTYSLVATVSPDNGSRHLAQPAHSIIVVQ